MEMLDENQQFIPLVVVERILGIESAIEALK